MVANGGLFHITERNQLALSSKSVSVLVNKYTLFFPV